MAANTTSCSPENNSGLQGGGSPPRMPSPGIGIRSSGTSIGRRADLGPGPLRDRLMHLVMLHRTGAGEVSSDDISSLADAYFSQVVEMFRQNCEDSKELLLKLPSFTCSMCFEIFRDPCTTRCGHSFCRTCVTKQHGSNDKCKLCNYKFSEEEILNPKTNVLISEIIQKLWPHLTRAHLLRSEGNELFQKNKPKEALLKYKEAIGIYASDHFSFCNKARVYLSLGKYNEALERAERATHHCPLWFKSYFRKAAALIHLRQYEEAFFTLGKCAYLVKVDRYKENVAIGLILAEITKTLSMIWQTTTYSFKPCKRLNESPMFSPYPSQQQISISRNKPCEGYPSNESDENSCEEEDNLNLNVPKKRMSRKSLRRTTGTRNVGLMSSGSVLHDPIFIQLAKLFSKSLEEIANLDNCDNPGVCEVSQNISMADFECSLCYRMLYQTVTTICGHSYCRSCLERCLDHSPSCPLCKTPLNNNINYRNLAVTHSIEQFLMETFPHEYNERVKQHMEDLDDGLSGGNMEVEIPIFVCTNSFPTVPCKLHVFEPRYRLMIRRCMESGSRRFGMCCYLQDAPSNYGDFGTVLEIRNIEYFPDGRSIINTVGLRRFRVLRKFMKDGYNVASVQFVEDISCDAHLLTRLEETHNAVYKQADEWVQSVPAVVRQRIRTHFGDIPVPEDNWSTAPDGPAWTWWLLSILPVDAKTQLVIIGMNSLQKRLDCLSKVLRFLKNKPITSESPP